MCANFMIGETLDPLLTQKGIFRGVLDPQCVLACLRLVVFQVWPNPQHASAERKKNVHKKHLILWSHC